MTQALDVYDLRQAFIRQAERAFADYDLGTARGKIEIDASGAEYGIGKAIKAQDDLGKKSKNTSTQMMAAGGIMVSGAAAIAGGLGVAVNAAANFEKQISGIAAVSGATGPELDRIREKALKLGADTKFSAGEAAGAMEELIKAGLSVDDVMNGAADATVNLAAAGEIDLTSAATVAANAMNAFGLGAEELPKVADLIAGAANASAIDVGEFAQSMQQSAAVANLAGLSFDDLSVAIAAMGNAGIKGSDAGTSLKTFLQNLQPVTDRQVELFKELGIVTKDGSNQFYDAQGNVKSMAEIAGVLNKATEGLTTQQKQMALETMFGSDAIRAAAVIADNGADGFKKLAGEMGKVTAQEVAEKRMDNLAGSIEQLKGSVETLLIIIGRPLADALRGWVDKITAVVNWISNLDESTLGTAVTIAKMVAAFLGVVGGALLMVGAFNKVKAVLGALRLVMMAHPLFFIAAAIIGVGVALYQLYQRSEAFRKIVDRLFASIKSVALPIINALVAGFKAFWYTLTTGFTEDEGTKIERIALTIRDAFFAVRDFIVNKFIPAIKAIAQFFIDEVLPVVVEVGKKLLWLGGEIVERVVGGFKWLNKNVFPVIYAFGELVFAIGKRVAQVVAMIIKIIKALMPVWKGAFNALKIVVQTILAIILNLWRRFGDNIWQAIRLVFNTVKTIVESALRYLKGFIQLITGIISGDWSKAWEGIKNMFGAIWDAIKAIPGLALEAIILAITTAWDVVIGLFENAWEIIKAGVRLAWNNMRTLFGSGFDKVMNFIRSIPGKIGGLAKTVWNGFVNGAKTAVDKVFGFFRDLPGNVASLAGRIGSAALSLGKTIIKKLAEGISNVVKTAANFGEAVAKAVKNVMNGIIRKINDLFDFKLKGPGPLPDLKINLPDIPTFHEGGEFRAPGGGEGLALLKDGEGVLTKQQMEWLKDILRGMGMTMASLWDNAKVLGVSRGNIAPSTGGGAAGGMGGGGMTLQFVFPNVRSGDDADKIKATLGDPNVLQELIRSIRAGVGKG